MVASADQLVHQLGINIQNGLLFPRCLEDHENIMASICLWRPEAKNKLLFVPRPERYDLFRRPEKYLLGSNSRSSQKWDQPSRQALLQEFLYSTNGQIQVSLH